MSPYVQTTMNKNIGKHSKIVMIALASCLLGAVVLAMAQQRAAVEVAIGNSDIGGVVTSANGPEAGVWVVAETADLPTKFAKMVVTDEQGRYVIPELPKANYNVWVRGYGLVDSPKVKATPGAHLNLTAVPAPTAAAAAEYYPGVYWYSMLQIPDKSQFPGTGPNGNGISPVIKTQDDWNDAISTDKRNPRVNANGLIYGSPEESTDMVPVLNPITNEASQIKHPYRDPNTPSSLDYPHGHSPYWDDQPIWDGHTTIHNPIFDEKGRVWFTARIRAPQNPAYCKAGSDLPSAQVAPLNVSGRQLSMYDPKTGKFSLIDTCFSTQHLYFGYGANNTRWTSAGGPESGVVGWLNTKMYLETGDAQKSQGWTPLIIDTNGNGKRDAYVEANQPLDPKKDKRIVAAFYGVQPSPVDDSIWGQSMGVGFSHMNQPGYIVRLVPGPNPHETALAEIYQPPDGFGPRGIDLDTNGVVWTALASGHLASLDRRKCEDALNGPAAANGKQCPEGWTSY